MQNPEQLLSIETKWTYEAGQGSPNLLNIPMDYSAYYFYALHDPKNALYPTDLGEWYSPYGTSIRDMPFGLSLTGAMGIYS